MKFLKRQWLEEMKGWTEKKMKSWTIKKLQKTIKKFTEKETKLEREKERERVLTFLPWTTWKEYEREVEKK